jgi:hypothetical protein
MTNYIVAISALTAMTGQLRVEADTPEAAAALVSAQLKAGTYSDPEFEFVDGDRPAFGSEVVTAVFDQNDGEELYSPPSESTNKVKLWSVCDDPERGTHCVTLYTSAEAANDAAALSTALSAERWAPSTSSTITAENWRERLGELQDKGCNDFLYLAEHEIELPASLDDPSALAIAVDALTKIKESGPANEPAEEDYDDTESAYNNGQDVAAWEAAIRAAAALDMIRRGEAPPEVGTHQAPGVVAAHARDHLLAARDLLSRIGARQTLARVRLALRSVDGAVRHASRERMYRVTIGYYTRSGASKLTRDVAAVNDDQAVAKVRTIVRRTRGFRKSGAVTVKALD